MWKTYIKRIFVVILLLFSLSAIAGMIIVGIDAVMEINRIKSDPSASGIDYLDFQFYPMFIAFFSIFGLICSGVSLKLCTYKITKIISFVLFLIFGVVMFVAFPVWLMR